MKRYLLPTLTGLLFLTLAIGIGTALAQPQPAPAEQASPLHPNFLLLDKNGESVLVSGGAVSTMQTCGQCHDTDFIQSHAFHSDLGLSDYQPTSGFNASNGLFGQWNPLTYRFLSPAGDERLDLGTAEWLMLNGGRVVGGGPATTSRGGEALTDLPVSKSNPETAILNEDGTVSAWDWKKSGTMEMNCFLCHLESPNNEARIAAIQAGEFGNANTATLLGLNVVTKSGDGWTWNVDAFNELGEIKSEILRIQDPTNANCAACHGKVHADGTPLIIDACNLEYFQTATTGQVISAQRINQSGINLAGKNDITQPWDIHAQRQLKCTDCHFAPNNPAHVLEVQETNPTHLLYDPRKLEIDEYLQRPDHNFARGVSAQFNVAPELKSTMRRCDSCHDTNKSHAGWLPYNDRHMQVIACETCHIPQMYAPAYSAMDWTVLRPDGSARSECRGIEGSNTVTDLVTGYQPVLMQRTDPVDGKILFAPYNLITSFYWVYEDGNGNLRPVRQLDLKAVYFDNGKYAADVLSAFDADKDGNLSDSELVLDTEAKQNLVAGKLEALGLKNVHIEGQVQPYSINHNVVDSKYATRDCTACHNAESRVTAPILLADSAPAGVTPEFVSGVNVTATGNIVNKNGALYYNPVNENDKTYIFGHNRIAWIDWFGALLFVGTVMGVGGHATLRYVSARRNGKRTVKTKSIYMYEAYERFWHWLQTAAIVILLLTGLVIHRPDLFGAFSFRHIVTIHNVLAVLLALNALVSILWHVISGEIQQYIPHPYGFIDQMIAQAKYYILGIFKQEPHPFHKSKQRKFNPLQMVTYIGLLGVLLPLQGITGMMMWLVQKVPSIQTWFGGLPFLAPMHTMMAWLFASFIVGHVYLTTTGTTPLEAMRGMVTGWEEVEVHEPHETTEAISN
ncbi:MAG: cytochrome b/b6 domain-containing protein [Chloroflexi bacterium]|nr:cytochrome b/b6 domain-containing protein [Chloroflexota bacterium]